VANNIQNQQDDFLKNTSVLSSEELKNFGDLTEFIYYNPGMAIPFSVKTPQQPSNVNVSILASIMGKVHDAKWVDDGSRKALNFNGLTSYAEINNSIGFPFTNAVTVEAWIKPNIVNKWSQASVVTSFSGKERNWNLGISANGNVRFNVFKNATNYGSAAGGLTTVLGWNYVVGTFNGSGICVYLNGEQVKEASWGDSLQNVSSILIGLEPVNSRYFNGSISGVCIYNRALNSSEVFDSYLKGVPVGSEGLMAWWRIDEGSGEYLYDSAKYAQAEEAFTLETVGGISSNGWFNGTINLPKFEGTFIIECNVSGREDYKMIVSSYLHCTIDTNSTLTEAGSVASLFGTVTYSDGIKVPYGVVYLNDTTVAFSDGSWSLDVTQESPCRAVYQIAQATDLRGVTNIVNQPKIVVFFTYQANTSDYKPHMDVYAMFLVITLVVTLIGLIALDIIYYRTLAKRGRATR
jgi:hypothetical protein